MRLFLQYKGLRRENYILFLGRIVTGMGAMIWPIVTMILNIKLGMTATETAMFIIISSVLFLPSDLLGGFLADKFNKKMVIICCDSISIVVYILSGLLPFSIWTLCIALIGAFFQMLEGPAYNALVADVTPQEKSEKAFSLLYLGGNIGMTLSPSIAGVLFNNHLSLCFVISGLAIAVSTVIIGVFVKDIPLTNKNECVALGHNNMKDDSVIRFIRGSSALILFIIAMSFYDGAHSQLSYLLPLDITSAYPETGAIIYGTVTSLNCIMVVVFTPITAVVLEKLSLTQKYAIGAMLQTLSFAILVMALRGVAGYYISVMIFTIGEILTATSKGAYLSDRVPANIRGRIFGSASFISSLAKGGTKYCSGWLFDNIGLKQAWIYSIVMTIVAIGAGIILVYTDKKEFDNLYLYESRD